MAEALVSVSRDDPAAAGRALGLSEKLSGEVELNAELFSTPTAPALTRYTGVLYDALDASGMTTAQHARAVDRLWVGSALFGLVSADDPIPHYRLSAGTKLPGLGTLRSLWRPDVTAAVADWEQELVVDLRSGGYLELGPVPGSVTVDVVTEYPDGTRKVVSHFSKHHKGLLARTLATSRAAIDDVTALLRVARRAGHVIERAGEGRLTMVTVP